MKVYVTAVTIALGSTFMLINSCVLHDSARRLSPAGIATFR